MNPYTKRSLIHFLLSFAALAIGIAVFVMISSSITESLNQPVDKEAGLGEIGKTFAVIAGMFMLLFVGVMDSVFTSLFVYMFAYFSHRNAKLALEAGGDATTAPKALKILSLIQMIIAAIIAISGGLLIVGIFALM